MGGMQPDMLSELMNACDDLERGLERSSESAVSCQPMLPVQALFPGARQIQCLERPFVLKRPFVVIRRVSQQNTGQRCPFF